MKLGNILKKLIVESSKFQFLYDKNVKKEKEKSPTMDFETLKALILADPDTKIKGDLDIDSITLDNMDMVKAGKYSEWLVKNFKSPKLESPIEIGSPEYSSFMKRYQSLFLEDLYKVTEDLIKFEKSKPYLPQDKRDINKFTPTTLFELLRDFELPEKKKQKEVEKEIKQSRQGFEHKGSEIVFQSPKWTVIKIEGTGPEQKDAACYYGGFHEYDKGETRWCTSAPGLEWWNKYLSKGPLYVLLPNESVEFSKVTGLPKNRYQFHFEDGHFMDRNDYQIDLVEFMNKNPELKEYFRPNFMNSLISKKDKITIDYPESVESKYLAIYGFEEFFEFLPETLKHFKFTNKSKEHMAFDIPPSIGRFKQLRFLFLSNCVKSLPNEISECKSLQFISLPNNEELKKLPDSILEIPDIEFINLWNSYNVKLPNSFLDKFLKDNEAPNGLYVKKSLNL